MNDKEKDGTKEEIEVNKTIRNMTLRVDFRIKRIGSAHQSTLKVLVSIFKQPLIYIS